MPNYQLDRTKQTKSGITVVIGVLDESGQRDVKKFRLTFLMWEALLTGKSRKLLPQPALTALLDTATRSGLRTRELIDDYTAPALDVDLDGKPFPPGSYRKPSRLFASNMLTPLGAAVVAALPPCPPRSEWPERNERKPAVPKLTKAQQECLGRWNKHARCLAIPVGQDKEVEAHWGTGTGVKSTVNALVRAELLQPGIRGVTIVDGKLHVKPRQDPELVYCKTVLGALMTDEKA